MKLNDHIKTKHGGNVTAFAKTIDVTRQQVQQWIGYGCTIKAGTITRHKDVYVPKD